MELDAATPARVGGPSAGADAGGAAEPSAIAGIRRHAQQASSALRERVERCRIGAKRALMRALFIAMAMGGAIALGCVGLSRLIDGAAVGLAQCLGSAWQADLAVGATCLAIAAAVFAAIALPARAHRRPRRRADAADGRLPMAPGDGIAERGADAASPAAAEPGLAGALTALGDDVVRAFDVRAHIARHPIAAGASAFAIGAAAALAAFDGRRPSAPTAAGPIASMPPRTTPTPPSRGWMHQVVEDVLLPIAATWLRDTASGAGESASHRPPIDVVPAASPAA